MKLEAKALIKPFEALQGVGKIKISVNFLSSDGIGSGRVKFSSNNCEQILVMTQPAFTCSKLTIETLEQDVKYVQS